jgi:hypothetical protein
MIPRTYYLTEHSIALINNLSNTTGYSRNEIVDIAIMTLHQVGLEPKGKRALDRLYLILSERGTTLEEFCKKNNVTKDSIWAYCRTIDRGRKIWPVGTSRTQRSREKKSSRIYQTRTQYIDDCVKNQLGDLK